MDVAGDLEVRWPKKDRAIIALGEAYVARENGRPVAQRLREPELSLVQAALTQAQEAVGTAGGGEAARATAAEVYRQAMAEARPLLELALLRLKSQYAANLAQLQEWGLRTKAGARNVVVLKPGDHQQWASFLLAYVAREQGLPEAQRIADPPLAKLTALATTVRQSQETRAGGRTRREMGVQARAAATARLLELLQAAAVVLVVTRYDQRVTNDLQQWGYEVVAKAGAPA